MKNIFLIFGVVASISCTALSAMEIPKKEFVDQEAVKEVDLKQRAKVVIGQFLLPPELLEKVLSFVSHGMQKTQAKDWARCAVVNKEFNTLTHAWLPGNLQESGEYTLFKQVMKLRTIAAEVAQKSLAAGEASQVVLGEDYAPEPDASSQTCKGLFLTMAHGLPDALVTPWGKVQLYNTSKTGDSDSYLMRRLLQRLSITFYDVANWWSYQVIPLTEWLELDRSGRLLLPMQYAVACPAPNLAAVYRGEPIIVFTNLKGYHGTYAIHTIDREKVETPLAGLDQSHYRSKSCALMLWRTLHTMYGLDKGVPLAERIRVQAAVSKKSEARNSFGGIFVWPAESYAIIANFLNYLEIRRNS